VIFHSLFTNGPHIEHTPHMTFTTPRPGFDYRTLLQYFFRGEFPPNLRFGQVRSPFLGFTLDWFLSRFSVETPLAPRTLFFFWTELMRTPLVPTTTKQNHQQPPPPPPKHPPKKWLQPLFFFRLEQKGSPLVSLPLSRASITFISTAI